MDNKRMPGTRRNRPPPHPIHPPAWPEGYNEQQTTQPASTLTHQQQLPDDPAWQLPFAGLGEWTMKEGGAH